jgi:hypothetical protein
LTVESVLPSETGLTVAPGVPNVARLFVGVTSWDAPPDLSADFGVWAGVGVGVAWPSSRPISKRREKAEPEAMAEYGLAATGGGGTGLVSTGMNVGSFFEMYRVEPGITSSMD